MFKNVGLADCFKIGLPALIVIIIGFILAYQFVGPAPPEVIRIATGRSGGSYHSFAKRYADYLKREGITLDIVETAGSCENLRLLTQPDSGIDVALVQSGLITQLSAADLVALGSLYYEPLWVFHRHDVTIRHLRELNGKRIAVGKVGSGTRTLALTLLKENGIDESNASLMPFGSGDAATALVQGDIDVAILVSAPTARVITSLITNTSVGLFSCSRADAYARTFRYLSKVTLPEGVMDFSRNIPSRDITLLAPSATLIAKKGIHPALNDLLLQAAHNVHKQAGTFSNTGQFPSAENCDLPLSKDSIRYFKYGPPFLQRYLPFWLATLIDRLKIMLVPFIILLLPMAKIVPPVFQWKTRRRVTRWYRRLQEIDILVRSDEPGINLSELHSEISQMDKDVAQVSIPLGYADQLYNLRLHIDLIQGKIENALEKGTT